MNEQNKIIGLIKEAVDTISNSEKIRNSCGDLLINETILKEAKLKQGRITVLVEIENAPGRNFDELINAISKLSTEIQSEISRGILNGCQ